jgi:hypothetical protein
MLREARGRGIRATRIHSPKRRVGGHRLARGIARGELWTMKRHKEKQETNGEFVILRVPSLPTQI